MGEGARKARTPLISVHGQFGNRVFFVTIMRS